MVLSEELEELFFKATTLPAKDRLAFAAMTCADNAVMQRDLLRLLESDDESNSFLDRPLKLERELLVDLKLIDTRSEEANPLSELHGVLEPSKSKDSIGKIGHFEVHEILGQGASSTVLKATDHKLRRTVVLKVLSSKLAKDSFSKERFIQEARIAAGITHQNLVAIYHVEDQCDRPFIVMEDFNAISLEEYLASRPLLSLEEAVEIAIKICKGLSRVHAGGIVHRDLKPGNILIQRDTGEIKITDFGIAKVVNRHEDPALTLDDQVLGTPKYMSPEQFLGEELDARSDLFSLGSILYRMLTRKDPFDGHNSRSILSKLVNTIPTPVHELVPQIPLWLSDLVAKLHSRNPADRYQTAEDVLAACDAGRMQAEKAQATDQMVQAGADRSTEFRRFPESFSLFIGRFTFRRICMFMTPPLIVLLLGVLLKLQTASGELVVICDDPSAVVTVKASQGTETHLLQMAIGENNRMFLKSGAWEISITGAEADEYVISPNEIQVVRGGVTQVKISRKSNSDSGDRGAIAVARKRKTPVDPATEALLNRGAVLVVHSGNFEETYCTSIADLPDTDFDVHSIYLGDRSSWNLPLDFELLGKFPKVVLLDFSGTEFSDANLSQLGQFRQLEAVDLRDTEVTDAGMAILSNNSSVLSLALDGTAVGIDGLHALSRMRSLGNLTLSGAMINDEAMRVISEFPNLYALSCTNCKITDVGIQHLSNRRVWQVLTFYGTNITDAGIKLVSGFKELRSLNLENNVRITDVCVDDLLKISSLAEIDVRRTGISPEGRRRLMQVSTFHGSPDEP